MYHSSLSLMKKLVNQKKTKKDIDICWEATSLCNADAEVFNLVARTDCWQSRFAGWTSRVADGKQAIVNIIKVHYSDAIMGAMASQITSLSSVNSSVYSGADQSKHQSSAPLAFVRGIHRGPANSPHKWPVTRKMFPFDDFIMWTVWITRCQSHTLYQYVHNNCGLKPW